MRLHVQTLLDLVRSGTNPLAIRCDGIYLPQVKSYFAKLTIGPGYRSFEAADR